MAAGINPMMILQMLRAGGAGGGGAPPGGGGAAGPAGVGPGGAPGGGAGGPEDLTGATRELQGADPSYALKLISQLKKQAADLIPMLAFRAPAAARALMSSFKGFDTSIKELEKAAQTMQAVGGPINMSAIPRPAPAPGGPSLSMAA